MWKRPITHWVWAVLVLSFTWVLLSLGSAPWGFGGLLSPIGIGLTLYMLGVLVRSAYPKRRAWGRGATVVMVVYMSALFWGVWSTGTKGGPVSYLVVFVVLVVPFVVLAWYGFWYERNMTTQPTQ
jgi:hypothetical protein